MIVLRAELGSAQKHEWLCTGLADKQRVNQTACSQAGLRKN